MALEYVTARFPENEVERITGRAEALERIDRFVKPRDRLRIRRAGESFGDWRDPEDGDRRVRERVRKLKVGEKLIVQRERDREALSVRVVEELFVPDLGAAPELELIRAEQFEEFGPELLRDGGLWLCRFVDGTDTVSKHGYVDPKGKWKGAANDLFVRSGGMTQLKKLASFTVSRMVHHKLNGGHVIVDDEITTIGSNGNRPAHYNGQRHFHEHKDVPRGVPCL